VTDLEPEGFVHPNPTATGPIAADIHWKVLAGPGGQRVLPPEPRLIPVGRFRRAAVAW
jgi:hypothetical protein